MSQLLSSIPQMPAPVPVEKETEKRQLGDSAALRRSIYDKTLAAARAIPPQKNNRFTLQLSDVDYADPEDYSLADQKRAILESQSLGRRLRGTWRLSDADGNLIEEKKATVAKVPYLTPRGTFIDNGSEYTLTNQFRLKPGVYTRIKSNGELEAHVNTLPGQGKGHRYFLDPEKGVFYTRLGQAKIPLLPLLRAMGASNQQLQSAWGSELYASNMMNDNPSAISKYYERLLSRQEREAPEAERRQLLANAVSAMKLDPGVMKRTLGKPYETLTLDAILDTTKKLVKLGHGEADVDDRDHLAYQTVVSPDDLLAERLSKDYGGMQRALFHKIGLNGSLRPMPANALGKQLRAALLTSGLGQALEEVNAAEVFDT